MSYALLLSMHGVTGVVGGSTSLMETLAFAFPQAVNGVFHSSIASYAHFHDAALKHLKSFVQPHIIIWQRFRKGVNEDVRVYFCSGSSEKMGYFRKTGAKAM